MDNEKTLTPLEKFDRASGERVTAERGEVYGHPIVDFRRACQMQGPIKECQDTVLAHPLNMIAVKIARLIQTPDHLDSWIDIAGYARTAAMIIDKRDATWDDVAAELDETRKWPGEDGGVDEPQVSEDKWHRDF